MKVSVACCCAFALLGFSRPACPQEPAQEVPPELFEFLGMFTSEQGEWIDPMEMDELFLMEEGLEDVEQGREEHDQ